MVCDVVLLIVTLKAVYLLVCSGKVVVPALNFDNG